MFKIGIINKSISMIHIQVLRYQMIFSYQDKYYQITGLEFLETMQSLSCLSQIVSAYHSSLRKHIYLNYGVTCRAHLYGRLID